METTVYFDLIQLSMTKNGLTRQSTVLVKCKSVTLWKNYYGCSVVSVENGGIWHIISFKLTTFIVQFMINLWRVWLTGF